MRSSPPRYTFMRDRAEATMRPPALWGPSSPSVSWLRLQRTPSPPPATRFPVFLQSKAHVLLTVKDCFSFQIQTWRRSPKADELSGAQMDWCVSSVPSSQPERCWRHADCLIEPAQTVRLELDWKHSGPSRMTATSCPWEKGWKEKSPLGVKPSLSWLRLSCIWGFCVDNEFLKYGDPDFLFLSCI